MHCALFLVFLLFHPCEIIRFTVQKISPPYRRKIWKLSPMDIKSFNLWDEYTLARDAMFEATDTAWAPWFVARSEDKKRVRLNIISHLLSQIPYKEIHVDKVDLPKRKIGKVKPTKYPFRYVEERF